LATEIEEGLLKALQLIFSADPTVLEVTARSVLISGSATILSVLWGLPIAAAIGLRKFPGRFVVKGIFNSLLGVPTVALGLLLYLVFSKSGALGFLRLLYTPFAMIIGQAALITPIVVSFIANAIESVDPEIKDLAKTLGASETEASVAVMKESLNGIALAIAASFNRAIAELGVALMIGGNIAGVTSVLTTVIALETSREPTPELPIAWTIILLIIVFTVNVAINFIRRRKT